MFTDHDKQHFINAYVGALYWTSTDGENGDQELEGDLSDDAEKAIATECHKFINDNAALLEQAIDRPGYDIARAGHDFWLTRNGHGAGFWDRDELEEGGLGDRLTEAAKAFKESDAYRGDDGLVYVS